MQEKEGRHAEVQRASENAQRASRNRLSYDVQCAVPAL